VPVGVAYGTDPQLVIDTLMEIVNDHPRILSNPEPFVAFTDFGASSLDFVLYGYLADVSFAFGTRTELRLEIVKRFEAIGIEIPFPQRDVNLRFMRENGENGENATTGGPREPFDIIDTSSKPVSDDE
jgi:small-conductance mechanosensitive channel